MLNIGISQLYDEYYTDGSNEAKRTIAARELDAHLQALIGAERFSSLIDIGAGQGSFVALLSHARRADRIVAAEISASGLDAIRARKLPDVEAVAFDGYALPFADKSFDLAVCMHVLEHVEHERLFLREVARVARRAVFEVPLEHTLRVARAVAAAPVYGHINHYSRATFVGRLQTSGLRVERVIVSPASLAMEQHLSGRALGLAKHVLRRGALRLAPAIAPAVMVYNCTALVDCG